MNSLVSSLSNPRGLENHTQRQQPREREEGLEFLVKYYGLRPEGHSRNAHLRCLASKAVEGEPDDVRARFVEKCLEVVLAG